VKKLHLHTPLKYYATSPPEASKQIELTCLQTSLKPAQEIGEKRFDQSRQDQTSWTESTIRISKHFAVTDIASLAGSIA